MRRRRKGERRCRRGTHSASALLCSASVARVAENPKRRWVEYPNNDILTSSETVPAAWSLHEHEHTRRRVNTTALSSQLSSHCVPLGCFSLPTVRHHWLRHGRAVPPTLAELEADEARAAALSAKVKALNEADRKLRLQEMAQRALEGTGPCATATLCMKEASCFIGSTSQHMSGACSRHPSLLLLLSAVLAESAASLENLSRERDQHGGVGSWSQDKHR